MASAAGVFAPWRALRRFRRNPLAFLEDLGRRGPVVEFALGPQRVFLLSDPAGIEDVLVTNAASFAKGRALERAKRTLGEGLLTSEGAFHLRQRRLMQPAFHRARIAAYTEAMARTAVIARDTWTAGTPLDLAREMNRLTLTIVADTLFGAEVGSSSDTARVQQAITDVMEMFDLVMLPFAEWLLHLPLPRMRRYRAAQRALDELIYGIVADRRRSGEDRGDLLSMLLHAQDAEGSGGMTDRQLRDEVITLFLAGHETTANALTWTWVLLGRHPEVDARLQDELEAVLEGRPPTADDVAAPALHPRGRRRDNAPVSAGLDDGPPRAARLPLGRARHPGRIADPDEPVGDAPRSALLARPGALRSRALARPRRPAALRLLPLRRRQPRVHRRELRLERGHRHPGRARTALAPRTRSSAPDRDAASDHVAHAARRAGHAACTRRREGSAHPGRSGRHDSDSRTDDRTLIQRSPAGRRAAGEVGAMLRMAVIRHPSGRRTATIEVHICRVGAVAPSA